MNTSVTASEMPFARVAHAYFAETKYETLRMLRTIAFVIPLLALPVVIYVLFGMLMGHDAVAANPVLGNAMFVGYTVFAVMGPAMFGIGVTLASERDAGLLTLKRALPMPAGAYLASKMVTAMIFALLASAVMTAVALIGGQMTLSVARILAVAGVMIVGVLPFCALGLLIGVYVSANAAAGVTNVLFLPMVWLSGLFFPPPGALKSLVVIWPAFHLGQLGVWAAGLHEFQRVRPMTSLWVLMGVTVVFGVLAMRKLARKG